MKKLLLLILITIHAYNGYSQISFEKGYFIDNSNNKTECLIKNIDWSNNPTEFEYKLSEISNNKLATINNIKEFGIYNVSKYLRANINIDRSSDNINKLSNNRMPSFNEEEVFLKVLIEGKASLYSYKDSNLKRFYYEIDTSKIEQLVFKEYMTGNNTVRKNNQYKQQILNNVFCPKFTTDKIQNLSYTTKDLVNYFVDYNNCHNSDFINFERNQNKDLFNLSIRPGLRNSSLEIDNSQTDTDDTEFGNELGFRFGIEIEYILPFNQNKWSVILEPTYQSFESEKNLSSQTVKAEYKSIELPIGIRHYMFLSKNSKLFVNGSFVVDFSSKSLIEFEFRPDLEVNSKTNLAFGFGYKYNDKYSLEFRYQTPRNILGNYVSWDSKYNSISLILGYSLF